MKKVLIVNKSFELGGIQSSMINMANELCKYYEVHLFAYNPQGVMKERLDSRVKVLDSSWRFKCLGMSLKEVLRTKKLKMIVFRLFATIWSKIFNNQIPLNIAIKHQPKMAGYDLAIAYHQEQRKKSVVSGFVRVVEHCIEAKKKVAWLHFDSDTIDLDSSYNNPFYEKMDKLVFVSRALMENFAKQHPSLRNKVDYCYNFMLYDLMREKSISQQEHLYPQDKFICFSACRLTKEKAIVRAVFAIADILKSHSEVVWYIAGDGVEKENIYNAIRENNLENQIILIGNQPNPYPYIRNADLVLNVSYHEAAPMVFFESKALGTPILATRTSSVEEILIDKEDSFLCENTEQGIHDTFAWVMENKEMVKMAKTNLKDYTASNNASLLKIEELLK